MIDQEDEDDIYERKQRRKGDKKAASKNKGYGKNNQLQTQKNPGVVIISGDDKGDVFSVGRSDFNRLNKGEPLDGCSCTGRTVKRRVLEIEKEVRRAVDSLHHQQIEHAHYLQLVHGLLSESEELIKHAELHCKSISRVGEVHYGAICLLTNERLFLVDTSPARYSTFKEEKRDSDKSKRTFSVKNVIADDVWVYPIPIAAITGINMHIAESAEGETQIIKSRPKWPYAILFIGIILLAWGLAIDIPNQFLPINYHLYGLFIIFTFIAVYLKANLNTYETNTFPAVKMKSRNITFGCEDPISQLQVVWRLEISDNIKIDNAIAFLREVEAVRYSETHKQLMPVVNVRPGR